ncbi:hypothetical protein SAMD00019534_027480, partial [Acytostelium subglobosum LB1]|uniref:hypothetical protein n=1 Tax=Acytostelium subglobosum LB1 TaxID=1410327 RepID=UPI000644EBC7
TEMIDNFTILTKGGIVLWSIEWARLKGHPINNLIKTVLVQERSADASYQSDNYTLKWTFANEVDLIFVVVYQKILTLMYIEDLLSIVKRKFIKLYKDTLVSIKNSSDVLDIDTFQPFTDKFQLILNKTETESRMKQSQHSAPRSFDQTEKGKVAMENKQERELKDKKDGKSIKKKKTPQKGQQQSSSGSDNSSSGDDDESSDEHEAIQNGDEEDPEIKRTRMALASSLRTSGSKKNTPTKKAPEQTTPVKVGKDKRVSDTKISKKEMEMIDRSDHSTKTRVVDTVKDFVKHDMDLEISSDEEEKPVSGFMKYFQKLTGNRTIDQQDLEPILQQFTSHLTGKNVALDVAQKLVDSVGESLMGKKLDTFQRVNTVVKQTMEDTMTRILTPKKNIDILRDVQAVKGKRPYTIVFSGVNGVGKSTNLAKVCYWLKANGFKVMMAACDTFRSGAIEQLKTHAERLNVEVFERGYGKDAAAIAGEAIQHARETDHDVVLIDTTGRMQNNEPLMRALSKLVNQNTIDLVLFVGEALVGNDGVDQLVKFDKSLSILADATQTKVRTIDGIILTKFDTIDDKVGAAISMVYTTGHPIIFLGTGQNYTDLKRMHVKSVVKALLN